MEEAEEGKEEKYQEQVEDCQKTGWRSRWTTLEMGTRGSNSYSVSKNLDIIGADWRSAVGDIMEAVEKSFRWLRLKTGVQWVQHAAGTQAGVWSVWVRAGDCCKNPVIPGNKQLMCPCLHVSRLIVSVFQLFFQLTFLHIIVLTVMMT